MRRLLFTIVLVLLVCSCYAFAVEKDLLVEYSDVSTWHWAYETIQKLSSKGIISGYPDGTFKPENNITRAEAAKIFMMALNPNAVFDSGIYVCPDVTASHWASKYIINAQYYIVKYDDGLYKPEQYITRLEFANAIAKRFEFTNKVLDIDTNSNDIVLNDIEDLDYESINNIKHLVKVGIINGYEANSFRPNNYLTRAEASKVLSLAITYRENGIKEDVSNNKGWMQVDPTTGWRSGLQYDLDGNIRFYIRGADAPLEIYYDGKYFITPNNNITTVKREKLYTPDGLEWNVIWFGKDVVEYTSTDNGYILVDHYQDKEYVIDSYYIMEDEAEKIVEELFPYLNYEVELDNNKLYYKRYAPNGHYMGCDPINDYKVDENGKYLVSIDSLQSAAWSAEVNENHANQINFINKYKD